MAPLIVRNIQKHNKYTFSVQAKGQGRMNATTIATQSFYHRIKTYNYTSFLK